MNLELTFVCVYNSKLYDIKSQQSHYIFIYVNITFIFAQAYSRFLVAMYKCVYLDIKSYMHIYVLGDNLI